jgi:nicotinamidase-related amidase
MSNMNYILVVVDMQDHWFKFFTDRNKLFSVIDNCKKAITKAMKNNNPIIFLEFGNYGRTTKEIRNLVKDYKNKFFKIKHVRDGSDKVKNCIIKNNLNQNYIKLLGAFTEQCLLSTTLGLRDLYPSSNISVLEKACGAQTEAQQNWGLDQMRGYVKISKRIL